MATQKIFCRAGFPFNYDTNEASDESGLKCLDPSKAVQSQKDEADINVLVRRFGVTGTWPVPERLPSSGDFSQIMDFRSAMDAVNEAQRLFMEVPADIRGRFLNDPGLFVEFCSNPANQDELIRMGLAVRRPDPDASLLEEVERENRKDKIRAKSKSSSSSGSEGGSSGGAA